MARIKRQNFHVEVDFGRACKMEVFSGSYNFVKFIISTLGAGVGPCRALKVLENILICFGDGNRAKDEQNIMRFI